MRLAQLLPCYEYRRESNKYPIVILNIQLDLLASKSTDSVRQLASIYSMQRVGGDHSTKMSDLLDQHLRLIIPEGSEKNRDPCFPFSNA
jgi:hypothetical protein